MEATPRAPELRPEIVFLFDLVRQLVDGRIKIPRFQRPFVWRRDQMIDLLDSIYRQYPIGSLLAWETETPIVSLSSVGPLEVNPRSPGSPSAYLLDGHQRLSTIAGALVSSRERTVVDADDPSLWSMFFNARERTFEHGSYNEATVPSYLFPMSKMLDTFEFLQECQRVIAADPAQGREYVDRVQDVARAFQNYKIPVIQIRQTDLTEAVEIFARLNSKGQAMSADQMVSALLYRQDVPDSFDLAREIDNSMAILASNGFGGVDRTLVLRALLAAVREDIYRTDWTRIALNRREDLLLRLQAALPGVNASLERATQFLKASLGVHTDRLLPYAMQLTVLSSFFFAQSDPSAQQLALLKRWFWVSSFSGWFGGANPSRVNGLVRDVMDRVAPERDRPTLTSVDLTENALPLPRSFDMRSARTRVLLLVLLDLHPLNRDGELISQPEYLIQAFGPEAIGYVANTVSDREIARSPANRILRDVPSDRGQARNWLLRCHPNVREAVWASHAIPVEAAGALAASDASEFLRVRASYLTEIERAFMQRSGVELPINDSPAPTILDAET